MYFSTNIVTDMDHKKSKWRMIHTKMHQSKKSASLVSTYLNHMIECADHNDGLNFQHQFFRLISTLHDVHSSWLHLRQYPRQAFCHAEKNTRIIFSAPDPNEAAYDVPPDPLVGWGGGHPRSFPTPTGWGGGQPPLIPHTFDASSILDSMPRSKPCQCSWI